MNYLVLQIYFVLLLHLIVIGLIHGRAATSKIENEKHFAIYKLLKKSS